MDKDIIISFTVEEINGMLKKLGEIPAEHSFDLILYIKTKSEQQINELNVKDDAEVDITEDKEEQWH